MLSRPLRSTEHLFVSPSGEALPRWLQAFPAAKVTTAGSAIGRLPATALVWLRLDSERPALEQLAVLRRAVGSSPIIALSNHPDNEEALAMFSAGVRGYCNAHATAANLRQVANVVQAGGLWIGEALMQRLLTATRTAMLRKPVVPPAIDENASASEDRLSVLSKRELEVARTVAGGSSNKEVARQLGITERTVKAHVGAVFQKLNVRDRLHLALIVNRQRPT